jgi:APA family basic amino acid/polyamine antiporter
MPPPRTLGLVPATCLVVGQVVGIGIFLTPAEMAQGLGAPGPVHAMWGLGGFVAAFFSFGGWWEAARMAGEVRDPRRTLPRAFLAGVSIVTAVYVLTSAVFMALVPPATPGSASAFAALLGERLFGPAGGAVLALAVTVSVGGSLAAVMLGSPRTYVALSRDGLLPERLARLDPTLGTPALAVAIQAALASGLVLLGTFADIVAYFVFVSVAFIAASVAALYRLPAPAGEAFLTPARRFTPGVFVGLSLVLLGLLLVGRTVQALSGVAVVATGVPALAVLRRTGMLRRGEA